MEQKEIERRIAEEKEYIKTRNCDYCEKEGLKIGAIHKVVNFSYLCINISCNHLYLCDKHYNKYLAQVEEREKEIKKRQRKEVDLFITLALFIFLALGASIASPIIAGLIFIGGLIYSSSRYYNND